MTTRRHFVMTSAALAGGFMVGCRLVPSEWIGDWADDEPARLTPYVRVDREGIRIIAPRAEMGQGIVTTLAMLLAEELDADWDRVRFEFVPVDRDYYNFGMLLNGQPLGDPAASWGAATPTSPRDRASSA